MEAQLSRAPLMNFFLFAILFLLSAASAIEWPVFFEQLGQVHSIHNKWDLAVRVNINLPSLEARITKVQFKLGLLDADFESVMSKNKKPRSREVRSRLDELAESWKAQNRQIGQRCENLERRAEDLKELGEHQLLKKKRRRRRRKRQSSTTGFLKNFLGVAYHNEVDDLRNKVKGMDSRFSGDIHGVRSQTNNLRSHTNNMMTKQQKELKKYEGMTEILERKVRLSNVYKTGCIYGILNLHICR